MKKITTEEFIERVHKVHGNKYDYSNVEYKNTRTKVCIICLIHGEFWQTPNEHLNGRDCPKCSHRNHKYTTEEWIAKAKQVHGDKYDYSKVEYINNKTKVCIICPEHGEFWQIAKSHLNGEGCKKCRSEHLSKLFMHDKSEFIEKARKIHGNKYDYSKVEYKGNKTKVCIICPIHGEFWQTPNSHISGRGCYECGNKRNTESKFLNEEEFIKRARKVHGDKYDYSKVVYKGCRENVCIICPKHGEFYQKPYSHIQGKGCQKCSESKLEQEVMSVLNENNIKYEYQCNKNTFSFLKRQSLDFYLPEYNIAIECQGEQHFRPIKHFGGEIKYEKTVNRDLIKNKLCKDNNIKILYYTNLNEKYIFPTINNKQELFEKIINNGKNNKNN